MADSGIHVGQDCAQERSADPRSAGPACDNDRAEDESAPVDDVQRQLGRILGSERFRCSLRLTRFLSFVVETALAGKADTIKAYTIAVEALGRGQDFDPQHDPIVRVEAGRLRKALACYYAGAGQRDPLLIEIPRGSYVPLFRRTAAQRIPSSTLHCSGAMADAAALLWSEILKRRAECERLRHALDRQARELVAEIEMMRRALDRSRAMRRRQHLLDAILAPLPLAPAMAIDGKATAASAGGNRRQIGNAGSD